MEQIRKESELKQKPSNRNMLDTQGTLRQQAERMGDDISEVESQDLDHTKPHRLVSQVWKLLPCRDGTGSFAGGAQGYTPVPGQGAWSKEQQQSIVRGSTGMGQGTERTESCDLSSVTSNT